MRVESMKRQMKFMLRFDMGRKFARAYYRDEMKAKGLKPRFSFIY